MAGSTILAKARGMQPAREFARAAEGSGTVVGDTLPSAQAGPSLTSYPWLEQWYPVGVAADLAVDRPHALTLWGRQLVLWHGSGGSWACFADACPHRLAPLSEGRVVDGQLVCSYHGWRFEGSGKCVRVPQAMDARSEAAACSNRRACATSFPTAEAAGLVWVWPDSSPAAASRAAASSLPVHPDLLAGGAGALKPAADTRVASGGEAAAFINIGGGWLVREVPYGFDTMTENILDPGHTLFAHHGLLGRREDAVGYAVKLQGDVSLEGGFVSTVGATSRSMQLSDRTLEFQPPCFVRQAISPGAQAGQGQPALHLRVRRALPPRPLPAHHTSYADAAGGAAQRLLLGLLPRWALHLYTQEMLDGDLTLLHGQERRLEAAGDWRSSFFLSTPSDAGVAAYRRWLNDMAGGVAAMPWAGGGRLPPEDPSHERLLDRLHQHTERCPSCNTALQRLRSAQVAGAGAAATAAALAAWVPSADHGGCALLALAGGAVAAVASWMLPLFVYKDYIHAER
ncbi:Pheophorbide a oxygenase [Chlorella vulgaris]